MKKSIWIVIFFSALTLSNMSSTFAREESVVRNNPANFSELDTNRDGQISNEEYLTWHQHWLNWRFQRMDSNGDGALDPDEFKDHSRSREQLMRDVNGADRQGQPLQ
jgi:Ca2+-binding EF-hand superfamily protein